MKDSKFTPNISFLDRLLAPLFDIRLKFILKQIAKYKIVVALTKIDLVAADNVIEKLAELDGVFKSLGIKYEELVPISAKNNQQIDVLDRDTLKPV